MTNEYLKISYNNLHSKTCDMLCDQTYPFNIQGTANGMRILNPSVISSDKLYSNYRKIDAKNCPQSSCSGITYLNSDPRLFNAAGGTWLQLDKPPMYSTSKLSSINDDKKLDNYGQKYKSYSDINSGQIIYYTDRNSPSINFSQKNDVKCVNYTDPMSTTHPYIDISPNPQECPTISLLNNTSHNVRGDYSLSWIKDSEYHKQDIMSKQLHQINSIKRFV